ncbi:MAG: deoxyribodipyrimidine photo-lyase [Anaerolineales bacterium]
MKTAIWWIRRDLRLRDNQALKAALEQAEQVMPVFILDARLLNSPFAGDKRVAFLMAGLRELDASLRAAGSRLILRRGKPERELERLVQENGAEAILAEADSSPFARRRDADVEARLEVRWCGSPAIFPPGSVLKSNGEPYVTFTPFMRAWKQLPAASLPAESFFPEMIKTPMNIESEALPEISPGTAELPLKAGERAALERLAQFTQGEQAPIYRYDSLRNRVDLSGTSELSPYLRFGMLSARTAAGAARKAIQEAPDENARLEAQTWLDELIWRDFFIHILYHFPQVRQQSFRKRAVAWQNDERALAAWQQGESGYPLVDAAMRQLSQTGWMPNRARMVVASFLCKHLLVDWRAGERWFMQQLIDGDPAANNGGWQWSAGTGTDAAPYFRIFNPTTQAEKHDPQGTYIRQWLPELERVPNKYIHKPWEMPQEIQRESHCLIGEDYPAPIVDHAEARKRALEAYG